MSELERSARRAQRRLYLNRWLASLGWSLAGAAGLFVILIAVQRSFVLVEDTQRLYGWTLLGLATAVAGVSSLWSYLKRENLHAAAAHLDKAAGLKERISSGLYCARSEDPFAQAVVADAERASRGLSIKHHLPVQVPNSAAWAGGSVLLAGLFFLLFPTLDLTGKQETRIVEQNRKDRINKAEAVIRPMLQPDIKKLREENPNLAKELDELETIKDARLESPGDLRQEMMKKVEKLSDKLDQQAKNPDLAKVEEFTQMMRKLANEPKSDTPVGDLSQALAKGDMDSSAQEAIAKIQQQLAKEPKTEEDKKKAEQMQADLKQLSDKLKQISEDQKKLNEQMAKAGMNQQEAKEAMQKLAQGDMEALKKQLEQKGISKKQAEQMAQQMKKQCDAGSMASKLAQNMAKAAKGQTGQNGQPMDAADMEGLSDAAQQLSSMEQMEQEMNQLKSSMSQVNSMKNKLGQGCSQCNGTGKDGSGNPCQGCNGSGMGSKEGKGGDPNNMGSGMGDLGIGQGGIAPREETKYNTVNKQAKVITDKGAIISTQFINGEQFKGSATEEFREAALSAQRQVADDIAQEKIPRPYQKSVIEYFRRSQSDLAPAGGAATRPAR